MNVKTNNNDNVSPQLWTNENYQFKTELDVDIKQSMQELFFFSFFSLKKKSQVYVVGMWHQSHFVFQSPSEGNASA